MAMIISILVLVLIFALALFSEIIAHLIYGVWLNNYIKKLDMRKRSRLATEITQYTIYGDPGIVKVKDVLDKIEKKEHARLTRKPREKKPKQSTVSPYQLLMAKIF